MSQKKSFALRVRPEIYKALQRWADDELRSLNGQIEYILREALHKQGRIRIKPPSPTEIEEPD